MWGSEPAQAEGLTAANRRSLAAARTPPLPRGVPVPASGALPSEVGRLPLGRRAVWDRRADLLHYGVVKA